MRGVESNRLPSFLYSKFDLIGFYSKFNHSKFDWFKSCTPATI